MKYTEKQIRKAWKRATRAIEDGTGDTRRTIEILIDELNFAEVPRPASFTVYADDGEYTAEAENIVIALADFKTQHPRSFVLAIVDDAMRPRLTLGECDERSLGQRLGDEMNEPTYTPGLDD